MNGPAPTLELRDIHLPDPLSWWPPAPGWWLLALLPLLAGAGWLLHRRGYRHRRLQRLALDELEAMSRAFGQHGDGSRLAGELSALLRRIALATHPRQRVAGLTGEAWLAFLDRENPERPFRDGTGRALLSAPFQRRATLDAEALLGLCRRWILALPRDPVPPHPHAQGENPP